ncbi:hypothetical protein A5735_01330 [Mycolicibacter heraklionensis]|nr:hypothetical protein A5735_01330 [Mycolicibacter heraklionensis]
MSWLTSAPRPHHHSSCQQCSSYDVGGDVEAGAKLGQGGAVAVELGHHSFVRLIQPLPAHGYAVLAQQLEHAALAQLIALPQLGSCCAITVGPNEFGNQLVAQALI